MWSTDPLRDVLIGTAALVTGTLVFTERFSALPAALAAYAGAAWVLRLERDAVHRREETRHP